MPSLQSSTSRNKHQHGGALLVMLVILVMGITTVFITSLSGTAIQNRRNHSSAEALAVAKEALIGYALTYGDTHAGAHGYLPCPDMDGTAGGSSPYEGSSETCGNAEAHSMGRLPWRTLDLPALFDGSGECLWYAVSGKYKNNPPSSATMNWDNTGDLTIHSDNGNIVAAGEVVAAIIAPGTPLNGNSDRSGSAAPTCGGNYTAAAYLENDVTHGINNSDIAAGKLIIPHEHRDASGNVTSSTNDQITYITRQDIWNGIQKRIARQAKKCLDDYAETVVPPNTTPGNKYPWAVPLSDTTAAPGRTGAQNVRFGRFPDVPNINTSGGTCPSSSSPLSSLSAAQITTLNNYILQVQDALSTYISNPTPTNKSNLENKGDNLWDLAIYPPYSLPIGDPIRSAGWYVDNNCDSSDACNTSTIQTYLNAAFAEITDCTGSSGIVDSTMPSSWSSIPSCQFIDSASWSAWRDWVFYQVADGFQPGTSTGTCVSCLSITNAGGPITGSGNFHAVIAVAGKALPAQTSRIASPGDITQFLDKDPSPGAPLGDNQTGKTDPSPSTGFTTYRSSDPGYSTVNDLVLCVDGKNNCP